MLRFLMGLSIACLIAGCGDDADADKKDDKKEEAAITAVDDTAVV